MGNPSPLPVLPTPGFAVAPDLMPRLGVRFPIPLRPISARNGVRTTHNDGRRRAVRISPRPHGEVVNGRGGVGGGCSRRGYGIPLFLVYILGCDTSQNVVTWSER